MFGKILIANRGEIAVRVARTARRLGVKTVAVYSDVDAVAPHVRACDEAVALGGMAPADSYLKIDKIIDAAKKSGAEAVHPGYGFLSENERFADALDAAGLVFIGPTAATIRAMGSKAAAKDLMEAAGVPTTPGYQGEDQSPDVFAREAERIGYPVLLKATAGGGGKGMRIVEKPADLKEAIDSAAREGQSSFGDPRLLIEKYVPRARHLEVQIFGDGKGAVVHFFERDCSVQRRHQKIIEEAPAPNLPADVRARLLEAGVNAGKAVDYRGAGTVEFLYDGGENVYFMEMNTRLQVEHPVTEMITGVDLVEWQLRVAAGEPLPARQEDILECGHAFEARLYAENPDENFAPSIGTLTTLDFPPAGARIDSGVEAGQEISPFYDPMIAKIIVNGGDRREALARMARALEATRVAGLETNARFLARLCANEAFAAGDVSTRHIADHGDELFAVNPAPAGALAALAMEQAFGGSADHPWPMNAGFRLNKPAKWVSWGALDDSATLFRLERTGADWRLTIERQASAAARRDGVEPVSPETIAFAARREGARWRVAIDGHEALYDVISHGAGKRIYLGAEHWDIATPNPLAGLGAGHAAAGSLTAPMPGVIIKVNVKAGDSVSAGDTLIVMEAMKMEHAIKAPQDGVLKEIFFAEGEQVKDGAILAAFEDA